MINVNQMGVVQMQKGEIKMFIRRSKYEVEKLIAKQRIETLENIICPNGHDYKKVGIKTVAYDTLFGNDLQEDVYVCSRCRKIKE